MNQETGAETQDCPSRRANAARRAFSVAFLFALVFLAAWPWEMFQRIIDGPTLVFAASVLMLGAGLVGEGVPFPRKIPYPKGLGLPIALIAFACLQSALHSADPSASKALIIKYVWYLLLSGMAAPLFSRPGNALLAWRVFAVSAGLVGVYAVCCAAGWLTPALAGTHEYFGRRLTEDVRIGAFVRIAATTPDYNQAILPMLAGLPFLLVWATSSASRRVGRMVATVLALFVVAGVAVSFSRSGLLAVVAVFSGGALLWVRAGLRGAGVPPVFGTHGQDAPATILDRRRWTIRVMVGLAVVVLCLVVVMVAGGYAEMLVRRALRGFNSPDPSYRSRLYVFGLAFKLLPKYALFGCGIGASGAAIGSVAEPGKWMGTAIHSMPLMMWFETGILGLIGCFWLWWRLVRRVFTGLVRRSDMEYRRLGFAALGTLAVLFWMTAIQPFQELSLFPVLAALIIGPACRLESGEGSPQPAASRKWRLAFVCAMSAVALLVCGNIATYQYVASDVSKYATALESGLAAEQHGDWELARTHYASAGNIALHCPKSCSVPTPFPDVRSKGLRWDEREQLSRAQYYDEAFRAADLEFVFLRLPGRGGPPDMPYQVAEFGVTRCLWNAGKTDQALKKLENGRLKTAYPDAPYIMEKGYEFWPEAAYSAGEMYWQAHQFEQALHMWTRAAEMNKTRKPFPPLEYPFDVASSMDEVYQKLDAEAKALADTAKPADVGHRVAALLRLDRQDEAVNALGAAPADAPELSVFRDALKIR